MPPSVWIAACPLQQRGLPGHLQIFPRAFHGIRSRHRAGLWLSYLGGVAENRPVFYQPPPLLLQCQPARSPARQPANRETYTYDVSGNRTSSIHKPGAWAYNPEHQLLQWGNAANQVSLRYNPNGNLHTQTVGGQTRTHGYDAADRLVEVKDNLDNSAVSVQPWHLELGTFS